MDYISKLSESIAVMANVKSLLFSNAPKILLGLGLGTFTLVRIPILKIIFKQYVFPPKIKAFSIRKFEVESIRQFCIKENEPESIMIVSGEKGIGKSTAIDTALYRFPAAFKLELENSKDILNINELVTKKILDTYGFSKIIGAPKNGLPRFIFWHKLILRRNPIITISLKRLNNENFTEYYNCFRDVRIIYINSLLKLIYQ